MKEGGGGTADFLGWTEAGGNIWEALALAAGEGDMGAGLDLADCMEEGLDVGLEVGVDVTGVAEVGLVMAKGAEVLAGGGGDETTLLVVKMECRCLLGGWSLEDMMMMMMQDDDNV